MEILVFGLLAMRNGYRQPQETVVGEPHQLQPLDVRTLAHLDNAKNIYSKLPTLPHALAEGSDRIFVNSHFAVPNASTKTSEGS